MRGWSILTTIENFVGKNGRSVGDTEAINAGCLGGKAIHAALRSLTSTCSARLLDCGTESVPSGYNVRFGAKGDKRSVGLKRKSPPTQAGLFRHTVNKLAMDLSSPVVDNQYFKVLIVPQAVIPEVLRDLFAMFDRFSIRIELKADAVSHRDAVFHIEKKLSHGQSSIEQ
jgi:hypothetical protein